MLQAWTSMATKGSPAFYNDDDLRSIICGPYDRGVWSAFAEVAHLAEAYLQGVWMEGRVRLIFRNLDGGELDSFLFDTPPEVNLITFPMGTATIQVNCIRPSDGHAVFEDIDLTETDEPPDDVEPEEGLPIPPPSTEQEIPVTGYKTGRIISLWTHDDTIVSPPAYVNEEGLMIPYVVKGTQRGREINLTIGNMWVDPDDGDEEE